MRRVAAAVAVLAVAGCGGSGAGSGPVATTEVAMVKSYRFDPPTIEIEAGETVTWTNDDNFTHSVQVDGREDNVVEPGKTVSITFEEPGTHHYVCRLHSRDMEGEVLVR